METAQRHSEVYSVPNIFLNAAFDSQPSKEEVQEPSLPLRRQGTSDYCGRVSTAAGDLQFPITASIRKGVSSATAIPILMTSVLPKQQFAGHATKEALC